MRNVLFVSVFLSLFFLEGCGKDTGSTAVMSEQEAFGQLSALPPSAPQTSNNIAQSKPSAQNLASLITTMIKNGQIKIPQAHGRAAVAATSVPNLDLLTQILNMIQSGQVTSIWTLVTTLVSGASHLGSLSADIAYLNTVLAAALPIITTFAPQYAPIVSSLISILPTVESFLKIFFPNASAVVSYFNYLA